MGISETGDYTKAEKKNLECFRMAFVACLLRTFWEAELFSGLPWFTSATVHSVSAAR